MIKEDSLVTQSQASALLNVSVKTIYRLRQKGLLPTISIGKSIRIKRSDIEWLIEKKEIDHFHQGYVTKKKITDITMLSSRKKAEVVDRAYGQKIALRLKRGF